MKEEQTKKEEPKEEKPKTKKLKPKFLGRGQVVRYFQYKKKGYHPNQFFETQNEKLFNYLLTTKRITL